MAGKRPGGVTLVAVLVVIYGILQVLGGVLGIAGVTLVGVPLLAFLPIILLVLGILTILVGVALLRGGSIARGITTVVLVLDLAGAIFSIVQTLGTSDVWGGIVSGALALIGIILLWTRRASAFFRG